MSLTSIISSNSRSTQFSISSTTGGSAASRSRTCKWWISRAKESTIVMLRRTIHYEILCTIDVPNGYPAGKNTHRVWGRVELYTHGYGYGYSFVPTTYMGMSMVLVYPAHTLPIAILRLGHLQNQTCYRLVVKRSVGNVYWLGRNAL